MVAVMLFRRIANENPEQGEYLIGAAKQLRPDLKIEYSELVKEMLYMEDYSWDEFAQSCPESENELLGLFIHLLLTLVGYYYNDVGIGCDGVFVAEKGRNRSLTKDQVHRLFIDYKKNPGRHKELSQLVSVIATEDKEEIEKYRREFQEARELAEKV